MSGTLQGALLTRDKNLKSDPDYYKKIGSLGGSKSKTGGFYVHRDLARICGSYGGSISKRGKSNTASDAERSKHRRMFERNYKRLLRIQRAASR